MIVPVCVCVNNGLKSVNDVIVAECLTDSRDNLCHVHGLLWGRFPVACAQRTKWV